MHITFIQPAVGRKPDGDTYPKTWKMEPLNIATLSALTPRAWQSLFLDDRFGEVDDTIQTDLVCISAECYTARRAYQIAEAFRRRKIPVAIGGFHATLVPDEVAAHADVVLVGEAENYWAEFLDDAAARTLRPRYSSDAPVNLANRFADRTIFGGRDYGLQHLVETSRGCRFACDFCSITKFFRQTYNPRPIEDVVAEVRALKKPYIFFVDDNLAMDVERFKRLCHALAPLRKRWIGQLSIHASHDEELLRLMTRSGCAGVLIGFESLNAETLGDMGKQVNRADTDFAAAIARLRRHRLSIYATFVFGYDHDTPDTFEQTYRFAMENQFFFAAFNHLVPFPGTDVYARLKAENRLLVDAWWLDPRFRFGDVVFRPKHFDAETLAQKCFDCRTRFYSPASIFRRGLDFRANAADPVKALLYYVGNFGQQREVRRRWNLPFGDSQ